MSYNVPAFLLTSGMTFCLFACPCSSFSCLRNQCLPCIFPAILFFFLMLKLKWCFRFYSLQQDELVLGCLSWSMTPPVLAVAWHQQNLRSNHFYSISLSLFYVPHRGDDKIEMIATLFISFEKLWRTCTVDHNPK